MSCDISAMIGDLYRIENPTVKMYSFSRPAALFWQGAYNALIDRGYRHDEALEWLKSKNARWMLDSWENDVMELGQKMTEKYLVE